MKNTDKLAEVLREEGVRDFFAVTGGAAVHVIDSLIQQGEMNAVFHHHEQAASLAADAYARVKNLGVCVVTTGPGVTNTLTGLLCSWQDSVPTLFISGQARYSLTGLGSSVRQVGTQHLEVIPIVQQMTKKAIMLKPGDDIREILVDLIQEAQSGRKGPVWLDIPLDLQIQEYQASDHNHEKSKIFDYKAPKKIEYRSIQKDLMVSQSPVILLGRGITDITQSEFNNMINELNIPCLRTWGFLDTNLTIPNKYDFGVVGVSGQRGANKIISESDFVLSLGARWGQAVVGPLIDQFAPKANIHIVDIDENENIRVSSNLPSANTHLGDASEVLRIISREPAFKERDSRWLEYCQEMKTLNSEQTSNSDHLLIDQYDLFRILDIKIPAKHSIVIDGGGTVVYCSMQVFRNLPDRRIVIPSASAPMGTGLPHSIGVQVVTPEWATILICGDGSFPFNIQELQTLKTNNLKTKIILVNNNGYLSIQGTQDQFLEGRHFGSAINGGLEIPEFQKIVEAFGLKYLKAELSSELEQQIENLLNEDGEAVLEVFIQPGQEIYPRTGFTKADDGTFKPEPLSSMHPVREIANFIALNHSK